MQESGRKDVIVGWSVGPGVRKGSGQGSASYAWQVITVGGRGWGRAGVQCSLEASGHVEGGSSRNWGFEVVEDWERRVALMKISSEGYRKGEMSAEADQIWPSGLQARSAAAGLLSNSFGASIGQRYLYPLS